MTPTIYKTENGTPFLKEPGVVLLAETKTTFPTECLGTFLRDLDPAFEEGLQDYLDLDCARDMNDGPELVQLAGQLCYLSFGEKRTPFAENDAYLRRILSSGHGSVLEHANYTLLFYGIDRACTHELVRHRAGVAYSQVSQRYVDGEHLRFCMPYEYQSHVTLTQEFQEYIDHAARTYAARTEALKEVFPRMEGESATDWRKRIQSCAREVLPNSTEAPIVVTANARAWRHMLSMRCSKHADVRIRRPMFRALQVLGEAAPNLFADFKTIEMKDGTFGAEAEFPKP